MAMNIKSILGMDDSAGHIPFRDGDYKIANDEAHKRRMQELYEALQAQEVADMANRGASIMQGAIQAGGGGGGAAGSWAPGGPTSREPPRPPIENSSFRRQMVAMRLHIGAGEVLPFQFFETHLVNETVYVFLVTEKGDPVTLTDEVGLFPSDAFITQLRLLL